MKLIDLAVLKWNCFQQKGGRVEGTLTYTFQSVSHMMGMIERINHNISYCLSQFSGLVAHSSGCDNEVNRFGCVEMKLFPTKREPNVKTWWLRITSIPNSPWMVIACIVMLMSWTIWNDRNASFFATSPLPLDHLRHESPARNTWDTSYQKIWPFVILFRLMATLVRTSSLYIWLLEFMLRVRFEIQVGIYV